MNVNPFAHYETALNLRSLRSELLSSNIANTDTPGYQARDIDFQSAFHDVKSGMPSTLRTTSDKHIGSSPGVVAGAEIGYRIPMQPSVDGNTVEADIEQGQFAENTVQYRATLSFLSAQVSSLRYAIKGGE